MTTQDLKIAARPDGAPDVEAIRRAVLEHGLAIAKDAIPGEDVEALRDYWMTRFAACTERGPIIWGPHLGEANRVLLHRADDCDMYRSYDFLWNPPIDARTRDVGLRLNRLRNRIAEVDERAGEYFEADGYGTYITTSYYPPGSGWLARHEDRADERRHWHFLLLMTFKGVDYADGGLYVEDRAGRRIDVDNLVGPGDVVFFDGHRPHGVDSIQPLDGGDTGRLQLFSIPTFMDRPQDNDRLLEAIPVSRFLKAKLRPLKHRLLGIRGGGYGYAAPNPEANR